MIAHELSWGTTSFTPLGPNALFCFVCFLAAHLRLLSAAHAVRTVGVSVNSPVLEPLHYVDNTVLVGC